MVIPAYNEGRVIDRCLRRLADESDVKVVVAANGCTDDTVERARHHAVEVVEVKPASKIAALNAGDERAGDVFPRLYLDADIDLEPGALEAIVSALTATADPAVAMPRLRFDVDESSWLVRSFYRVYTKLPYLSEGLVGAGCYAVNSAGRARWGAFPDIVADDLFVQGKFARAERLTADAACVAYAPRRFEALVKVRTRTYHGNRQAAARGLGGEMTSTSGGSMKALVRLVAVRPWLAPDAFVYALINIIARRRAVRMADDAPWLTDSSSRS